MYDTINNIKCIILWNYIIIKQKLAEILDNFFLMFTDVHSIYSLKKSNVTVKKINEKPLYYVIILLNLLVKKLEMIIKLIDIKADIIEITKKTDKGISTILLDTSRYNRLITISDIIIHLHESNLLEEYELPYLITKCTLTTNESNICLKKYLTKYIDSSKLHDHILENIMLMNDITPTKSSLIHLTLFKNGKFYNKELNYNDIKLKHINIFNSLIY